MKTWKQIKMECLGLMASRTSGGAVVSLTSDEVADYVNEMVDAANYALRDLADVARPLTAAAEIVQTGGTGLARYDLAALAPDFMRVLPGRVMREWGGRYGRYDGGFMEGGVLVLPQEDAGTFRVFYRAYPAEVTDATPDAQTFSLAAEALDLVPIYMASRLYKDDDIGIATNYLNEYHARRAELIATASYGLEGQPDGFSSVTGWC